MSAWIERPEIPTGIIEAETLSIIDAVNRRIAKHGRGAFVGPHEGLGVIMEEVHELVDAVKANDPDEVEKEAQDILVGCLWLIASSRLRRKVIS